jgi:curved DNA-binding protein CbpA
MHEFQEDYYAVLGVEAKASTEDIHKAYLKLAKKLHPDRFPNDQEKKMQAQIEFSRVTRAHEVLFDAKQREEYDALYQLNLNRQALDVSTVAGVGQKTNKEQSHDGQEIRGEQQSKEAWAQKHYERAEDCYKKKRFQEAETAIKEAIRLVPDKALYHNKLAEIYLSRGWRTLAMSEVQTALRLDPKDAHAKQIEIKLKAKSKSQNAEKAQKKGFLDQIKQLLGKKE